MDYSSTVNEAEDAVGAAPWGSSPAASPRHNRSTFNPAVTDPPPFGLNTQTTTLNQDLSTPEGFQQPGVTTAPEASWDNATTLQNPEGWESATTSPAIASQEEPLPEPVKIQDQNSQQNQAHHQQQQIQQQQPPQEQSGASSQGQQQPQKPAQPQYRLQAKITGLERTGKRDPILRFDVYTNLPRFRTTQYRDVRRMHSEFVKLAEHLVSANPEAFVPACPPAVTSAGAGTEEDEIRVKALMQRWFNYVCSNEVLMRDDEMVLFVESDFGYSPLVKMKQPATGVRRKILKQFAPPPDDTPELAEARPIVKLFYLGSMDAGHKVDKLVKARRGLGLAESDYGVKLGNMHIQEPHPGLSNAFRKLGKVVQTMGDYHAAQATAEATTVGDPFQYHSQDSLIVKETLTNRQILTREFIQAQEATRSKLNAADRLKASSSVRPDKVDEAIAALDEAQQHQNYLYNKTTTVTQNLIHERRKWFSRTASDLRLSIREFVLREIEAERRTLALLESVRPDIRAIDASGGLSRLGRESHPVARRTSLATSQGPKGDAWSGAPRRSDATSRSMSQSLMGQVPEDNAAEEGAQTSGASGRLARPAPSEEEDDDRIDARNAASRLATSTF